MESNAFEISCSMIHSCVFNCFACSIRFCKVLIGYIIQSSNISAQLRGDSKLNVWIVNVSLLVSNLIKIFLNVLSNIMGRVKFKLPSQSFGFRSKINSDLIQSKGIVLLLIHLLNSLQINSFMMTAEYL